MSIKFVSPSARETAFNCPHCGALAKQFWYNLHAKSCDTEHPLPLLIGKDDERNFKDTEDVDARNHLLDVFRKLKTALPFFELGGDSIYNPSHLYNVHASKCFNCEDISLWIYDKLTYPQRGEAPPVNSDLPEDIRQDYNEASSILDLSPRGAAALVRLCIQKLCLHLGQPGKNLNDDIGALVADGLDKRVQKALDVVRVVGNHAVHPGQVDLRDDRATAESLFRLLNVIAEKMISEPKHVDEIYNTLPTKAKEAIEARDRK